MKLRRPNRVRREGGRLITVVQQPPSGREQREQAAEVPGELRQADMLEHPDRGDRVVGAVPNVPVVLEADLDAVGQAGLGHGLRRPLGLPPRDRDADRGDAAVARGMKDHPAPPASHVEQAHAGPQVQLPADQLVLGGLSLLERHGRVGPYGARVSHRGAQDEPEERVRHVVVVCDGRGVPLLRVPPAAQPGLLGRARQRSKCERAEQAEDARPLAWSEARAGQPVAEGRQGREDVPLHVELAGHVSAAQAELAWGGHQSPDRSLGPDHQGGRVADRTEPAAVVGPYPHREVGAQDLFQK